MLDRLIGTIAPHDCLDCGVEGNLLCQSCQITTVSPKRSSCFLCNALTNDWWTCHRCRRQVNVAGVIIASHYEGTVKDLIRQLKYEHTVAAAAILGNLIAARVPIGKFDLITLVPVSSQRFRQRGYNQAQLIAKAVATRLKLPFVELLSRVGQVRQVGTNRRQRLEQMSGKMYTRRQWLINDSRILVVDDVVTTGATLSEAGRVLKTAGAKKVWGAAAAKH